MLSRNAKERYMIQDVSMTEFTERLIDNIDLEKKGIWSDSKNEFYGTVSKSSFTLKDNKPSFERGLSVYGEFEADDNNVVITLEYRSPWGDRIPVIGLIIVLLYFLVDTILHSPNTQAIIILLIGLALCMLWIVAGAMPRQNELYLALKRIFHDKKISKAKFF
jgi:hypothetical protein